MSVQWWPAWKDWPVLLPETVSTGKTKDFIYRSGTNEAMALLILEGIITPLWGTDGNGAHTIALLVVCSNTFAYACADAEPITPVGFGRDDSFWELYDGVRMYGSVAAIAWCAKKRKATPLPWAIKALKDAGLWEGLDLKEA